jgi:hypothetical protein
MHFARIGWDFVSWKGECLEVTHLEIAMAASEEFEVGFKRA